MKPESDDRGSPIGQTGLNAMARLHAGLRMDRRAGILSAHIGELLPPGVSVLDVGAGNGKLARAIMDRRPDIAIRAIDTKIWPERMIEVEEYDGKTIPFPDGAFDVCLVSDVLHHCSNAEDLLKEMRRVARKHVLIKDHVANTRFDYRVLKAMDWFGNRGHEVVLTYDYWPWARWEETFARTGLRMRTLRTQLGLYSMPFSLLFDRKLHFVGLLDVVS